MKKLTAVLAGLFVFMLCANAYAEMKVAYVDIEKVAKQYKGTEKASKKLEAQVKAENDRFVKIEKEFLKEKQAFDKQKSILDKKAAEKKDEELTARYQEIMKEKQAVVSKLEQEKNTVMANVMEEIRAIIQQVAKEKGYDLVLIKELVLSGGEDITYLVIKKINE